MLNEDQLNLLPERLTQRIEKVNQHYLEMVGKRIKEIGTISPTDIHRLESMKDLGADLDKITEELAKVTAKNASEIYEIYDIVAEDNLKFAEKFLGDKYIPYAENKGLQRYIKALAAQSVKDYVNMSQNTAFLMNKGGKKVATSLSQAYTDIIDDAIIAVTSGQTDLHSAVRRSMTQLADSGLRTKYTPLKGSAGKAVDYATGYSRRLDTTARQNILWGVKQCNLGIQEQIGAEFGADGWEIDYHTNPRPTHSDMGGRQYAAGKARTINGVYYPSFSTVEGFLHDYGCLHFKWAIILGVSEPNHSTKELKRLKELDKATIEFEGEEYTRYEMSQIQRKLETAARHAKDRQIIAKAAGDDTLRRREQERINLITSKYAKVSKAAGLPTKKERMSVSKYHRVKSIEELADKALTTGSKNVRIKLDNRTVRKAYKEKVANIINQIDKTKPLENQARQAFELRNQYRMKARDLMSDVEKKAYLDKKRPNKTFDELLNDKMKRKNLTREEALKDILKTASTSNDAVNKELGL